MTNTPRFRRLAELTGGFAVALATPMIGLFLTLPAPPAGPALADCGLGYIDNPATPGQCVPVPGEGQERSADQAPTVAGPNVADNATGTDLSACGLDQPYQSTVCPGPPPEADGSTNVSLPSPVPGDRVGDNATGDDLSACQLNQPYQGSTVCPGAPVPQP